VGVGTPGGFSRIIGLRAIGAAPPLVSGPGAIGKSRRGCFLPTLSIIGPTLDNVKIFTVFFLIFSRKSASITGVDKSRQSEVIMAIDFPTISGVKVDGEKLRQLREDAFLSRAELGAGAGLHPDYIGKLERGDWQGGTRIDNIRKLAEVLGVDPHELVKRED
jgi:hypothetical protein